MDLTERTITCRVLCLLLLFVHGVHAFATEKKTIGWVEKTLVYPGGLKYKAKIDTGARTTSINARNIEEFEREGLTWVRFDMIRNDQVIKTLEVPLVREATIKRHFGKQQSRYVVILGICLGNVRQESQVTLVDRKGFNYDLLIGRNFLKKDFVVDPSESFMTDPDCKVHKQ